MNIMDTKQRIKDLSTFLLLNSCALPSSGLALCKAGVALALFEAAHFLKDDYLEDKAFGLIEEALLTKTEDISLSSGTSGIGLVLKHLIGRKLLEADFSDLFEDRPQHISQRTEELIGRKLYKLPDMMGLYVFWHYMDTDRAVAERQCCLDIIDRYLSNHFSDLEKGGKLPIDLTPTVALLASYLQMLYRCHGEGSAISVDGHWGKDTETAMRRLLSHDTRRFTCVDTTRKSMAAFTLFFTIDGNGRMELTSLDLRQLSPQEAAWLAELQRGLDTLPPWSRSYLYTSDGRILPGRYISAMHGKDRWVLMDRLQASLPYFQKGR